MNITTEKNWSDKSDPAVNTNLQKSSDSPVGYPFILERGTMKDNQLIYCDVIERDEVLNQCIQFNICWVKTWFTN